MWINEKYLLIGFVFFFIVTMTEAWNIVSERNNVIEDKIKNAANYNIIQFSEEKVKNTRARIRKKTKMFMKEIPDYNWLHFPK